VRRALTAGLTAAAGSVLLLPPSATAAVPAVAGADLRAGLRLTVHEGPRCAGRDVEEVADPFSVALDTGRARDRRAVSARVVVLGGTTVVRESQVELRRGRACLALEGLRPGRYVVAATTGLRTATAAVQVRTPEGTATPPTPTTAAPPTPTQTPTQTPQPSPPSPTAAPTTTAPAATVAVPPATPPPGRSAPAPRTPAPPTAAGTAGGQPAPPTVPGATSPAPALTAAGTPAWPGADPATPATAVPSAAPWPTSGSEGTATGAAAAAGAGARGAWTEGLAGTSLDARVLLGGATAACAAGLVLAVPRRRRDRRH
jgi:hypothetical protein